MDVYILPSAKSELNASLFVTDPTTALRDCIVASKPVMDRASYLYYKRGLRGHRLALGVKNYIRGDIMQLPKALNKRVAQSLLDKADWSSIISDVQIVIRRGYVIHAD